VNPPQIDEAILSAVGGRWTKVAVVIAKVTKQWPTDLPPGEEGYLVVAPY
jgi:hypothetical protein